MVDQTYVLNPTVSQASIAAYLESEYPHIPFIEDGLVDGNHSEIQYFPDGSVKPFVLVWYSQMKRSASGRSFSSYKLDSHMGTVDLVAITNNPTDGRILLNDMGNRLVGFQVANGGRMYKSASLWGDSRQVLDTDNRPSRWARTDRYDFGIQARKTEP